ncbi:MHO_4530 family protein [Mycoplasma zalophi]|uniref:MHO_4530 family protein n=1 Tax=Mycoplasma zalophi TaxID=191287 RepID=UPI00358DF553
MSFQILIFIFTLILFTIVCIIIFAYINKHKNNYGVIPLTIDYKSKRIKLLSYKKSAINLMPFTKNEKLNNGKWLSFEEFSDLFLEPSKNNLSKLFQEIVNNKQDLTVNLMTKKHKIQLTLISPTNIEEENAALLYWQTIYKEKVVHLTYVDDYKDIVNEKDSFKVFFNLKERNIHKKDLFLKFINKKLDKKYKYKIFVKYSIIYLSVNNLNKTNLLNKYFYKLLKIFETSFLSKLCNGIIFIPSNFQISKLDININSIDYLQFLTKKESKIIILNNSHLTDERVDDFEANYKKISNLLQKDVIKYIDKPVYEFFDKLSDIKFIYPEMDNNNQESNYVLKNTSLKYNFLDKFVNIKIENDTSIYLFPIIDYDFLYLSGQEIKKSFIDKINQIKIVVVVKNLNNLDLIYTKALSLKTYGIDVIVGVSVLDNNIIQLIKKINADFVVLTKKITSSLDVPKDFSYLVGLLNFAKDSNIKFIFEDIDITKQGYKIRKNLNIFLYSKEIE